jgi:hypothetical protein
MKPWLPVIAIAFASVPGGTAMAQSCAGDLAANSFCANLSGSTVPATATTAPPIRFLGNVSPTGNPTGGPLLTTYAPFSLQTSTIMPSNREFIVNIGMTSDMGFGSTNGNGDKVGLYVGAVAGTNSSDLWAVNFLCELKSNLQTPTVPGTADITHSINSNCNETDYNNNYANYLSLSPGAYGQINSGAGIYQSTAGMAVTGITPTIAVSAAANVGGLVRLTVASTATLVTGFRTTVAGVATAANGVWSLTVVDGTHIDLQGSNGGSLGTVTAGTISGPIWQYGFLAVNNTANEAAFYDFTGAKDSFRISGTHQVGINTSGGAFTKAAILLGNNAPLSALENDGTTVANILYLNGFNVTQIGGGFVVDSVGGYRANGNAGVSCPSGVNATTMRVVLGIVTAC